MATATYLRVATPNAIPVREILPWAIFGGLLLLLGELSITVPVEVVVTAASVSERCPSQRENVPPKALVEVSSIEFLAHLPWHDITL